MEKALSQDEMDALLNNEGNAAAGAQAGQSSAEGGRRLTVYDFRRPDRVPKGMLHALQMLHDRFCTAASSSLSAYFRMLSEVTITSVEQANFSEFIQSMPDPACLTVMSMRPLSGLSVLELSQDLAFPLIDRLLGGGGHATDSNRKMTEIEKNVVQGVIKLIMADLGEAWKPVTEANFQIHATESRPQLLQIAAPSDVMLVYGFDVKIGETRGGMHVCIPYSVLEPISSGLQQESDGPRKTENYSDLSRILRALLKTSIEITSELPGTMISVKDLLSVCQGDIITLDPKIDDSIELRIAGKPAFQAKVLDVNGHKGAAVIRRIAD